MMEKWTGVEKEVLYIYFSKRRPPDARPDHQAGSGSTRSSSTIGAHRRKARPAARLQLLGHGKLHPAAYAELGTRLRGREGQGRRSAVPEPGLPSEIWHARDGILSYPTMKEFLKAVAEFQATGTKLNATYVYDQRDRAQAVRQNGILCPPARRRLRDLPAQGEAAGACRETSGKVVTSRRPWRASAS